MQAADPIPLSEPQVSEPAGLSKVERRAAWSLSLIYLFRMLGLFIVLPVFSLFADQYAGSTPVLIGLAIGIYGLMQALLQIPLGALSDRFGRKRVITGGLVIFAIGSVVAATADSIGMVIAGRALQGAGAIAAALMALAADLTRDSQRTKIMATLGASIGLAFILALVLGPLLIGWFSIDVLFWITALCAVLGLLVLHTAVPDPQHSGWSPHTGARMSTMRSLMFQPQLLRLNVSIFSLHLLITATFFAVPLALRGAGLANDALWTVYLPAVVLSLALMVPLIVLAERRAMRGVLLLLVAGLALTQGVFWFASGQTARQLWWLGGGVTLFFVCLNTLEALLPSLVSRLAPASTRGSAMGIYSTSQFLGAFTGGVSAGWLYSTVGEAGLWLALAVLCALWLLVLSGFKAPVKSRAPAVAEPPGPT